jgi:hypothetical protein
MTKLSRRAALAALGAGGGAVALGYVLRGVFERPTTQLPLANGPGDGGMMGGGMMGVSPADMQTYMEMFNRHKQIDRMVEDIPGGVRTTTQSEAPDLVAKLQAHVSSMYSQLDQGAEVMCMSSSLPTLFRRANGFRRQLTFTPTGVIAEETADDPVLTDAIREHAREVTGFVEQGMPAMMQGMMDGMMDPGMMGPR